MQGVTFWRIIKGGFVNFFRNGLVSLATVLVMSLSMLMLGGVVIGSIFVNGVIKELESKVDINVYFNEEVLGAEALQVKDALEKMPEVRSVEYVSRELALERFLKRHEGDELILRSIEVVEENPFSPSLEIQAVDPSKFEAISVFLESGRFAGFIAEDSLGIKKITYRQNQVAIDRLAALLSTVRFIGFAVSAVLGLIALMVAYNTVRLAIYSSKDEISVMQLVGASHSFIRGPFLVEGVIHGVISVAFTLAIFYPVLWWAGQKTAPVFGGLNVYAYYSANIIQISIILLVVGVAIGVFSALFAMRRYLKV